MVLLLVRGLQTGRTALGRWVRVTDARASRGKLMHRPYKRIGWPTIIGLLLVVVAFMVLSLLVTATGTARFAVSMGYDASVGYAVGAVFDVAKGMLLVGVVALWGRGALGVSAVFAIGWICLVTFSWLATHATVSTAIASIERTGTWKMEVRGNAKAELTSIEQQLAMLSRPTPPRPVKTVAEALASTNVPSGVWKNSHECAAIQDGAYFAKPCADTVQLRRELAAAQDHERLSARAAELRQSLAVAPIVSTSDPLPAAFAATLGRLVPVGGAEGVALLLTMVVEIVSCFGLAALSALCAPASHQRLPASLSQGSLLNAHVRDVPGASLRGTLPTVPKSKPGTLPKPSLEAAASERADTRGQRSKAACNPPSNVVAMPLPPPPERLPREPPRHCRERTDPDSPWSARMCLPSSRIVSSPHTVHRSRPATFELPMRVGAPPTTTPRSPSRSLPPS